MLSKQRPLNILIAPNAFKHSLPADEVAAALAEGLKQHSTNVVINCCPVADGGDGTGKMLAWHLKAKRRMYKTLDAFGRPISAPVYYTKDQTAIIELSDASGLKLLRPSEYAPMEANTYGTGILLKKALSRKVKKILLAIGGSATVDGGTGILKALGVKFLNRAGIEIKWLPAGLPDLHRIDISGIDTRLQQTELILLCDVENKLLGTNGAAKIFGPQKGATKGNIGALEKSMKRLNKIVHQASGIKMNSLPHSGAAGGVAASMVALSGAKAVNGIDFFLDALPFNRQLLQADIVITGEGSLDAQTLEGKAPLGVAKRARKAGIKVIGIGGNVDTHNKKLLQYFDQLIHINPPGISLAKALRNTRSNLVKTGEKIGRLMQAGWV